MLIKLYHINIIRDMIPVYYKPESQGNTSYAPTIPQWTVKFQNIRIYSYCPRHFLFGHDQMTNCVRYKRTTISSPGKIGYHFSANGMEQF